MTSMLGKTSLEIPEKKKQAQNVSSARSSARLQENSTIGASKAKGLQSMGSSKMLQVASSREFGRELTTNSSIEVASLPAFAKQKSIVSTTTHADQQYTGRRRTDRSKVSHPVFACM